MVSKGAYEIEEKYGLFKVLSHDALQIEPSLFDHKNRVRPYNLSALECVETATTKNELRTWLEENKGNFHNERFVVMPVFDVEYKINFDE